MKITSKRTYALVTGILLFVLGFAGFAFRENFAISNTYLIGSLILGFWGIVVGASKSQP
jgi:hypothetical protein